MGDWVIETQDWKDDNEEFEHFKMLIVRFGLNWDLKLDNVNVWEGKKEYFFWGL